MRQLDLTERLLRLRGVPVFRNLSATALAPLAASMRSNTFEKGDVLLREDEPPKAFHMLLTGSVTMRRRGNTIRTITAPGGVGFLSVLAQTAGGTEAVADARVETFELSADALDEMFEDHFSVLFGTMRWIAERLVTENIEAPPAAVRAAARRRRGARSDEQDIGIVERIFLVRRTLAFREANVNSVARLARNAASALQARRLRLDARAIVSQASYFRRPRAAASSAGITRITASSRCNTSARATSSAASRRSRRSRAGTTSSSHGANDGPSAATAKASSTCSKTTSRSRAPSCR